MASSSHLSWHCTVVIDVWMWLIIICLDLALHIVEASKNIWKFVRRACRELLTRARWRTITWLTFKPNRCKSDLVGNTMIAPILEVFNILVVESISLCKTVRIHQIMENCFALCVLWWSLEDNSEWVVYVWQKQSHFGVKRTCMGNNFLELLEGIVWWISETRYL